MLSRRLRTGSILDSGTLPVLDPPVVIAEVGCNHQGDLDLARKMVRAAARAGADIVKFQKRDLDTWRRVLPWWDGPHPNPTAAFGSTYYEHRRALELDGFEHRKLADCCREWGVGYSCSVWDLPSLAVISEAVPFPILKIPSAANNNLDLIRGAYSHTDALLHISCGMMTAAERQALYESIILDRTITYQCTSGYPVPFGEVYLLEIESLPTRLKGYSGHHVGTGIDLAAYARGASYIERHFTQDRTLKGTDNAFSLEPPELAQLVHDLHRVHACMNQRPPGVHLTPVEESTREKLKWRTSTTS